MTSKLTSEILDDETLAELIAFRRSRVEYCQKEGLPYQKALHDSMMLALEELQERRKVERDSEPVAYIDERNLGYIDRGRETAYLWGKQNSEAGDVPLYRHAQPASEREQVRREHAEWSQATFGNVGPVGPLKHLSKEALEAAAEPGDLSEWADIQFLLWDAQRRAGVTDEQITQAMLDKLAVNKQRKWPEPKDGEPRLHIKEQPVPAVPDELLKEYLRLVDCMLSDYRDSNYGDAQRWIRHIAEASDTFEEKHGLSPWEMARKNFRAAMLNGGKS